MKYSVAPLPPDIALSLANKHRDLRRQAGFSQAELAERSGVSLGSLKRFEQSGRISLRNLLQLALILGRLEDFADVFSPVSEADLDALFSEKMRNS